MTGTLLEQAIAALGEAAEEERSMRIGHDVARVLHNALTAERAETAPDDAPPHEHAWATIGWDRPDSVHAHVIQSCVCGAVRDVRAEVALP